MLSKGQKLKNEKKAWDKYKKWQGDNLDKIRPGQEIRNFDEFQAIYNDYSINRQISRIKYEVQYQMSNKTYRTLRKRYKDTFGKTAPKEFSRQRSTQELAEYLKNDIDIFKQNLTLSDPTLTGKEIALLISEYFFGS